MKILFTTRFFREENKPLWFSQSRLVELTVKRKDVSKVSDFFFFLL